MAVTFEVLSHLHRRLVHVKLVLTLHVAAKFAKLTVSVEPWTHECGMRRVLDSGVMNSFARFEAGRTASSTVFPTATRLTQLSHINEIIRRDHQTARARRQILTHPDVLS